MITPGAELLAELTQEPFYGHMPIAGRRTLEVPAPRRVPGLTLDLRFTVLHRPSPAHRMQRIAYGSARVASDDRPTLVTLHTDTHVHAGLGVHLAGLAHTHASRHAEGALTLTHRGNQLGDPVPWSCPRQSGSARLQAFPLRLGGVLYVMTRSAGPCNSLAGDAPLT